MVADEISSLRLMLSENRISGFEGVCGEDDVELARSGVSRWIDRWMFHRGFCLMWGVVVARSSGSRERRHPFRFLGFF